MESELHSLEEEAKTYLYLENISEEFIFSQFIPALLNDNNPPPLSEFTQKHRDSYTYMKIKALQSSIKNDKSAFLRSSDMDP